MSVKIKDIDKWWTGRQRLRIMAAYSYQAWLTVHYHMLVMDQRITNNTSLVYSTSSILNITSSIIHTIKSLPFPTIRPLFGVWPPPKARAHLPSPSFPPSLTPSKLRLLWLWRGVLSWFSVVLRRWLDFRLRSGKFDPELDRWSEL